MKLKLVPLTITVAVTAALLFGGWTAYRHYAVEKPIDRIAASVPGVRSASASMENGQVVLKVKLEADASLADIYRQVKRDGAASIGGNKLELQVDSNTSDKLEQAWSYSLFDVAESMENRHYSNLRAAMDKLSKQFPGVTATTEMDEDNVYVRLVDGQSSKFVVLPRQPASLGVWPNA